MDGTGPQAPLTSTQTALRCRNCGKPLQHTFIDLGMSPLCESFLTAEQLGEPETFYPLHVRVCDSDDTFGSCSPRQLQLLRNSIDSGNGSIRVDLHRTAQKLIGPDTSENDVSIRNGGQFTLSVTSWTGHRSGALRTHAQ